MLDFHLGFAISYNIYMKLVQLLFFGIFLAVSFYIITPLFFSSPAEDNYLEISETASQSPVVVIEKEELKKPAVVQSDIKPKSEAFSVISPPVSVPSVVEAPILIAVESPAEIIIESLSKFDEAEIMSAVVRVRCGKSYGSGFSLTRNDKRYILTAAHVVIDQVDFFKQYQCDVIFPRKDANGNYQEAHYRTGKILFPDETLLNYKEKGIDLAVLEVVPLADKNEDLQKFPNGYPYLSHSFCPTDTLGDSINLWGFSANLGTTITPGAFMSKFQGDIVQYEDVIGVTKKTEPEFLNGFVYLPKFEHSLDQNLYHHLIVILSNNNFSGASGGLVFNTSKACIVGVNIATLVQDNKVFGFVTNPEFGPIKEFVDKAIAGI